jgi:nicotinate phosphoribosyltransferase
MTKPRPDTQHFSALFTDLYELTMAQAYDAEHMAEPAVFELFFRKMPKDRNYLMAAGLDDVLRFLETFRFTEDDLAYLRERNLFSESFLDRLGQVRFTGDVFAMPEGTPVFPNEPLIQIVAPVLEAQLVETYVLNQIHFQSVIAAKAARVVTAAEGRDVVEFGARRAHGTDAALKVARASYLAGAVGTSNVLAGKLYDIPIFGTMAHSYVQAHNNEEEAFEAFAQQFQNTTLLVDTYDTLAGVRKVVELARRLGDRFTARGVRLDSGDLADLAFQTRRLLDQAGLQRVTIFASSGLDEHQIHRLVQAGAPIDAFGVGTKLVVSSDAPALDMAYKLVEYAGQARFKLSSGKVLLPGRKQIFRTVHDGCLVRDVLGCWGEQVEGQPLLCHVMHGGRRTSDGHTSLASAREHARRQLAALPAELRSLDPAHPYSVLVSDRLQQKMESMRHEFAVPR